MVFIMSLFNLVYLPTNSEFTIHTEDYYIDDDGQRYDAMPHGNVYEYGDLIIETPQKRYIYRKVYSAYDYCVTLIQKIKEHKGDPVILIDLDELNEVWGFQAEGGFEVQHF